MHADRPDSSRNPFRRWKTLVALSAATVLLHVGLLGGTASIWPEADAMPAPPATLQTRIVPADAGVATSQEVTPPVAEQAVAAEPLKPIAKPHRAPRPAAIVSSTMTPPEPLPERVAPLPEPTLVALQQQPSAPEANVASTASASASAADSEWEQVPTYRTEVPPTANLRYLMQRGILRGTGELHWQNDGEHYQLRLDGSVAGLTILSQASQGIFDSFGLAPVRFTDQRLRRQVLAANFQRQAGKITFSGPQTEYPIWPGVQDRLSWMIQLAAIASADPIATKPGGRIAMHVMGARGDAAVWALHYVGRESVETLGAAVMAEKFVRDLQGPRDTRVEIWLDPQRHHLPVRATLRNGEDDDALELTLQQLTFGP